VTTTRLPEFTAKLDRVRRWLEAEGQDAVELTRYSWLAWLLGGVEARVLAAGERGSCAVRITRDRVVVITNNIEAPRLREEEGLAGLPVEWEVHDWWLPPPPSHLAEDLPPRLRFSLLPEEVERARRLAGDSRDSIETVARSLEPGLTEHQIASRLAEQVTARGIVPIGLFVAADERGKQYRHPIPTAKIAQRNAILSMVVRRGGLHASLTRMVSFGPACESMQQRHQAVTQVNAAMLDASRPGATLGAVFAAAQRAYAEQGFPDEWQLHHQGGPTGYEPREIRATPESPIPLEENQLVAWNPTIRGSKSEETALVTAAGVELLTAGRLSDILIL
jgi:Xaa-Pro aminopeptidase